MKKKQKIFVQLCISLRLHSVITLEAVTFITDTSAETSNLTEPKSKFSLL
jgi:hypothetical protein